MTDFYRKNRKKLFAEIDDNSFAVFFAGEAPIKRGDEFYPFSPERNFYYLTGLDNQRLILVMLKSKGEEREILFIERFDEAKARWVGAVIREDECRDKTGINDIKYLDEFEEEISSLIFNNRLEKLYLNLENRYFKRETPVFAFADKVRAGYPYVELKNIYPVLSELRTIKSKEEIECIKKAAAITADGIYEMMKHARSGMFEYEIEAYFDFVLKKNGVRDKAFNTIAASGKNAVILHYSENNSKTGENDLILFDVGAAYGYYSADITRTFPVSGKFSERQRQLYDIVLEGQNLIINNVKPGIMFKSLNETLKKFYAQRLKEIGLIKEDSMVSNYYYHGVSHFLGLETHDVGRHNEGVLKEGMVLTVEPGLYVEEEGIGIRIEDDVVVTKDGCEVLSSQMIKTADEIEGFMREYGVNGREG